MSNENEMIRAAVLNAVQPSWAEIVRSKKAILEILSDGKPKSVVVIQTCLYKAEGISPELVRNEKLELGSTDDIDLVITPKNPIIAKLRFSWAASEALVDLIASGIAVATPGPASDGTSSVIQSETCSVQYKLPNNGASIAFTNTVPEFNRAYRLSPRLARCENLWFCDPDVFTADLGDLKLDSRTSRCIEEALAAYRHGLYLSCANLLGAAYEGAWFAAGEQLRGLDDKLASKLDTNAPAKQVSERVAEVLRQIPSTRSAVDELISHSGVLRELRNYGVHPRNEEVDLLERYFEDSSAAMLLMQTHNYLSRLNTSVAIRLAPTDR